MSADRSDAKVIVIGAGPAGMMAAEVLAEAGCSVTLLEHMRSPGRKLLLAGRSGLNLTNAEPIDAFLQRYGAARHMLEPAMRAFDPGALRSWAASLGEDTYIGTSGRVFPDAWRATPLLRAWLRRLDQLGVRLQTGSRFIGWETLPDGQLDPRRVRILEANSEPTVLASDAVVLALGGASWPRVGSDGGWVPLLRAAGVDVADLAPANAALEHRWSEHFIERFEGVPLKNIAVTNLGVTVRGDVMVTKRGLEGLPAYAHTASVRGEIATGGTATITIDLHPDIGVDQVRQRLAKRRPRDSWSNGVRRALGLTPVAIALVREATDNKPPVEPSAIAELIKALPLTIDSVAGIDRAISSAGGVRLTEIDEHFMLRSLPGVFVAGEMIDWEAPTGGYLLQAAFATGVAAARGALRWATMAP